MSESAKNFWDAGYSKEEDFLEVPDDIGRAVSYAIQFFGSIKGKRVLDIGCGHGGTSLFLAKSGADVTAIDFSAKAIERLKSLARNDNVENLDAVADDVMKIDQFGQFDFIFGSLILHHLEPFSNFCDVSSTYS